MSQSSLGLTLLQSGSILLAAGFAWGIFIPRTRYPRIALSTHVNMILHGLLSIAAGYILREKELVDMSPWQFWTVAVAHYYLWAMDVVSVLNAWWGTNKALAIVSVLLYSD
jgi:hypothetical protein